MNKPDSKPNMVDLYFMDARAKLIDIAAFMDRVERAEMTEDFRYQAFLDALKALDSEARAERVLLSFSDATEALVPAATTKAACGAWPEKKR